MSPLDNTGAGSVGGDGCGEEGVAADRPDACWAIGSMILEIIGPARQTVWTMPRLPEVPMDQAGRGLAELRAQKIAPWVFWLFGGDLSGKVAFALKASSLCEHWRPPAKKNTVRSTQTKIGWVDPVTAADFLVQRACR